MATSDAMRLIEKAERETPGEQPPIVLIWEEYKQWVAERDEARAAACALASRIREYRHLRLIDLEKELAAWEADCPWLKLEEDKACERPSAAAGKGLDGRRANAVVRQNDDCP